MVLKGQEEPFTTITAKVEVVLLHFIAFEEEEQ